MDRTPFAVLQRDATGYQRSCALTAGGGHVNGGAGYTLSLIHI